MIKFSSRLQYARVSGALFLMILLVLATIYALCRDNIHAVIPNTFYRSAQLDPKTLSQLIEKEHIQMVLNLRGAHPESPWYQREVAVLNEKQIAHADLPLRAYRFPEKWQLEKLIQLIERATEPKLIPILIHCESGADRTGLVSALAVFWHSQGDLQAAWAQISWRYGAVYPHSVGKLVFNAYEEWLQSHQTPSSVGSFKAWVATLA